MIFTVQHWANVASIRGRSLKYTIQLELVFEESNWNFHLLSTLWITWHVSEVQKRTQDASPGSPKRLDASHSGSDVLSAKLPHVSLLSLPARLQLHSRTHASVLSWNGPHIEKGSVLLENKQPTSGTVYDNGHPFGGCREDQIGCCNCSGATECHVRKTNVESDTKLIISWFCVIFW